MHALLAAITLGSVMIPSGPVAQPSTTRMNRRSIPERWRTVAENWSSQANDETVARKWGLEVALIKRGIDVVWLTDTANIHKILVLDLD